MAGAKAYAAAFKISPNIPVAVLAEKVHYERNAYMIRYHTTIWDFEDIRIRRL
jgi:hypothetical protein